MNPADAVTTMFLGSALFMLLIFALGTAYFVFWLIALVHCIQHKHDKDRMMWIMVIIFVPFFGALFYMTMGRTKVPPSLPTYPAPMRTAVTELPPLNLSGAPLNILAMQDEKKRAASINEALSAMTKSGRR